MPGWFGRRWPERLQRERGRRGRRSSSDWYWDEFRRLSGSQTPYERQCSPETLRSTPILRRAELWKASITKLIDKSKSNRKNIQLNRNLIGRKSNWNLAADWGDEETAGHSLRRDVVDFESEGVKRNVENWRRRRRRRICRRHFGSESESESEKTEEEILDSGRRWRRN